MPVGSVIKSIQSVAGSTTTGNITIAEVDLAKAFISYTGSRTATGDMCTCGFVDSTHVFIQGGTDGQFGSCMIIEYF